MSKFPSQAFFHLLFFPIRTPWADFKALGELMILGLFLCFERVRSTTKD